MKTEVLVIKQGTQYDLFDHKLKCKLLSMHWLINIYLYIFQYFD